jgi:hypothetical protein
MTGIFMKSSRGLFIALAAISFIGSSVGCYTLLKHPRVQIDDQTGSAHEDDAMIGFADDCSACHSAGSLQTHHPAIPPPRRIVSPEWDYYYDYPWWIPYYTPVVPGGNPATEEEQKKRPFDRRHLSQQDDANTPSTSAPVPTSNPGTVAKPVDSGNSQPAPQPQDTNKREEKRSGDSQSGERRTRKP